MMISRRQAANLLLGASLVFGSGSSLSAQSASAVVVQAYGRARVEVETARAQPGGVLGVVVRGARWASANTLLDGRRGALSNDTGTLFGIVPIALDTTPAEHKLSLYFPGGRRSGGAFSMKVTVTPSTRPARARALTPEGLASATSQTALGHARFLLNAIRSHDPRSYQLRPLQSPVNAPVAFPFGGIEDFGVTIGPSKDGLMGEQHRGVDYDVPPGTAVRAPGSGVVLLARSLVFSGETVVIDHGRGLVSVLSHLSYVSVSEGDVVSMGATVGTSGRTGLGAVTPHLCFSVYLHSINVDPEALMDPGLWTTAR